MRRRKLAPATVARLKLASRKVRKLVQLLGNRAYWPALKNGIAASVEHSGIPFCERFETVLDVGASRGQFALFARESFPGARIVCFEPQPGPAADLRDLLGDKVELVTSALGAEPGTATMNVSNRDDSSSLLTIGARQVAEFPGTGSDHSIDVPVSTLDESIQQPIRRPCLLKIDVQGFELNVLRGGALTLKGIDVALIECSFVELYEGQDTAEQVISFMADAGFRLAGVHGLVYSADRSSIQADFLFRREHGDPESAKL